MADNKAATAAAQTQSDKPKKNDGKKKVSFFDKVKNFFKGIGKYFKAVSYTHLTLPTKA